MTRAVRLASVPALILCSAGALQPLGAQPRENYDVAEAERAMDKFARCVVQSDIRRRQAHRLLRLVPGTPHYREAVSRLATDRCAPQDSRGTTRLSFGGEIFRSTLFAALYRAEFGRSAPSDWADVPVLSLSQEFDGPIDQIPDTIRFVRSFGDCVARLDSSGVHRLLFTDIGSEEERVTFNGLMPSFGQCLPQGRELRFSRIMLRGMLAEGAYKLRTFGRDGKAPRATDAVQEGRSR